MSETSQTEFLTAEVKRLTIELERERAITSSLLFAIEELKHLKRIAYVPVAHFSLEGGALCNAHAAKELTSDESKVTCRRCLILTKKLKETDAAKSGS